MRSLNSVQLIGRLGRAPELKYTGSSKPVATFTLATNSNRRNAAGGWDEETEWHTCVAWEKLAETANQLLTKGSLVYVTGRLQTRQWEKDGQKQQRTEIVINDLIALDGRAEARPTVGAVAAAEDDEDVPF